MTKTLNIESEIFFIIASSLTFAVFNLKIHLVKIPEAPVHLKDRVVLRIPALLHQLEGQSPPQVAGGSESVKPKE